MSTFSLEIRSLGCDLYMEVPIYKHCQLSSVPRAIGSPRPPAKGQEPSKPSLLSCILIDRGHQNANSITFACPACQLAGVRVRRAVLASPSSAFIKACKVEIEKSLTPRKKSATLLMIPEDCLKTGVLSGWRQTVSKLHPLSPTL